MNDYIDKLIQPNQVICSAIYRLYMNSIFHIQSSIINQMLCIYFRIDISDKIISELIFQTRRISTRMVLGMFFHYRCIVETQETFQQEEIFLDKEYYNNHYPNIFSV